MPARPIRPSVEAIDLGHQVALSRDDFLKLTQYLILLEGYADMLEMIIESESSRVIPIN
ncbi:hypothetical protein PVA45_07865 (plasmid) [Entomospira entomophila]|uniref:Uncharacterized protein n=1 Tax=Entomospira entomophila TaxID=2719988 RepID=A0A968GA62_9SPIO|nr:hypothetical protein [Entomospira entomophilus]NIZ41420.1 hypothetical protein [Entomospira entomophilus]WDI36370.1 hypothetical protein PVA45_07865 [Entomospira entomophilus]